MKNKHLYVARTLLIIGFLIGLKSWWQTFNHIGDETYTLIPEFTKGKYHAWYHAFREAIGDLSAMAVLLFIFFGRPKWRTPTTWWISLMIMVGYYAPFWIGTPFVPQLGAPHIMAEMIHVGMATFPIIALFLGKKCFFTKIL